MFQYSSTSRHSTPMNLPILKFSTKMYEFHFQGLKSKITNKMFVSVHHNSILVLLILALKFLYIIFILISGQACFAVSRLISWASVGRGWIGNLVIPIWCYYPLYHNATVYRLHVTRVLDAPRGRTMHMHITLANLMTSLYQLP